MPLPARRAAVTLGAGAVLLAGGCGGPDPASSQSAPASTATRSASASTTNIEAPAPDRAPSTAPGGAPGSPASPAAPVTSCPEQVLSRLGQQQRIGQLLMAAVTPSGGPASLDSALRDHHVGGVLFLGGWRGLGTVTATSEALQAKATAGVGLLVAADQEGGQIQQLRGAGFPDLPSAARQGQLGRPELTELWTGAGKQLATAGVNVDLAPVADVVTPGSEAANAPIGKHQRHYGTEPAEVAGAVEAVVTGLARGNVTATLKHFPGLGRVSGNPDFTATGITDAKAGADDPNLASFRAGITAGAGMVMVSSARYPLLDPQNQALFSPAVIDGLLRTSLGYAGVVLSDDVGVADAVAGIPTGERATRFLAAGGDIVLTANAGDVPAMAAAIADRTERDPAFGRKVQASVLRVLALKERMGLLRCG